MQNNTVLLDSNFLLVPVQFKIDIYEEIRNLLGNPQFIILAEIFNELYLKLHRERRQKFRLELKTSLELLEQKKKETPEFFSDYAGRNTANIPVDDYLIEVSRELSEKTGTIYIATNDKQLRKKAGKNGIKTIFMRKKQFLTL